MTKRGSLIALLVGLAFAAVLLWSTLASQRTECTVTVSFGNSGNAATASAASQADALREAQTTACGPLTQGMNDRIACSRVPPVAQRCRAL